jgi:exodeoxyribonuclease V alpha subunit
MLTRPLLYTAITRARSNCVLIGDPAALRTAVGRGASGSRYSGLAERLSSSLALAA